MYRKYMALTDNVFILNESVHICIFMILIPWNFQAFIKRLLQVCSHQQPAFTCGALVLLSKVKSNQLTRNVYSNFTKILIFDFHELSTNHIAGLNEHWECITIKCSLSSYNFVKGSWVVIWIFPYITILTIMKPMSICIL
jgi:hypothetical protein